MAKGKEIGTNIQESWDGPIVTLKIDTSKEFGLTKSEKSIRIATTGSSVTIHDPKGNPFKAGINVYKTNPDYEKE